MNHRWIGIVCSVFSLGLLQAAPVGFSVKNRSSQQRIVKIDSIQIKLDPGQIVCVKNAEEKYDQVKVRMESINGTLVEDKSGWICYEITGVDDMGTVYIQDSKLMNLNAIDENAMVIIHSKSDCFSVKIE